MYQKNKNTSQAILPLVENMNEAVASGKYGIAIMADLEGAFYSIWTEDATYKLYKAEITNNLLLVLTGFLKHCQYRNLVNTHTGNWSSTTSGVSQGSILSTLIFLIYTADMTDEEEITTEHELFFKNKISQSYDMSQG